MWNNVGKHTAFAGQFNNAINADLTALRGVESGATDGGTLLDERAGHREAAEEGNDDG